MSGSQNADVPLAFTSDSRDVLSAGARLGRTLHGLAGAVHGGRMRAMSASPARTATVEVDIALLERLRERAPGKTDRELVEDLAVIALGDEAITRMREAFADVPQEEVEREAVRLAKETRRERAAQHPDTPSGHIGHKRAAG